MVGAAAGAVNPLPSRRLLREYFPRAIGLHAAAPLRYSAPRISDADPTAETPTADL